jgi:hypothetical protein
MKYNVTTFRSAGLEAKWSRTSKGAPIIVVRNPAATLEHQRTRWWFADQRLWNDAAKVGIVEAFDRHTLLGDVFAI